MQTVSEVGDPAPKRSNLDLDLGVILARVADLWTVYVLNYIRRDPWIVFFVDNTIQCS